MLVRPEKGRVFDPVVGELNRLLNRAALMILLKPKRLST